MRASSTSTTSAAGELVLRATHGTPLDEMTRRPRLRPGEGITGTAAAERRPVAIAAEAHLDPRWKEFPNLPESEYESILAVPILAREQLAGALNVRTREPREFRPDEIELLAGDREPGRAVDRPRAALRRGAAAGRRARGARADLRGRLRVALPRGVARGDRQDDDGRGAGDGRGARARGRPDRLARGRAPAQYAVRTPLRWKRREIGELVADRDTPFTDEERALLEAIAHHAAVALEHGRAVMRGVLAQEIHHRVKNNLQTVASLLRLQARAEGVDPREALEHSVNRILAIAAVHEALTEQREEDVELAELIDRLRAMLVQGIGAGRDVEARLEPVSLAGTRATALALVFSELLQNALEHGAGTVRIELARRDGDVVLAIADEGAGADGARDGTGLSIVRALVADELHGSFALAGPRAEVVFPA